MLFIIPEALPISTISTLTPSEIKTSGEPGLTWAGSTVDKRTHSSWPRFHTSVQPCLHTSGVAPPRLRGDKHGKPAERDSQLKLTRGGFRCLLTTASAPALFPF